MATIATAYPTNLFYQKKEDSKFDNIYTVRVQDMGEDCEIQSSAALDDDGFVTNSEPYSTGSRDYIDVLQPLGVSKYPSLRLGLMLIRRQSSFIPRTPKEARTYVSRSSTIPGRSAM